MLGIYLGGRGTDWKPMPTLITVLVLQALLYFTMLFAMHDKVWMTVNLLGTVDPRLRLLHAAAGPRPHRARRPRPTSPRR